MDKIIALCKKYKVRKLFVFGSILTNRFNKESDVDFIVNFDKAQVTDYFSNFFDLKYALEDILGREVDLLTTVSKSGCSFTCCKGTTCKQGNQMNIAEYQTFICMIIY